MSDGHRPDPVTTALTDVYHALRAARDNLNEAITALAQILEMNGDKMISATKHQPPVPDKDTGFSKDPAGNTIDVNWTPIVEEPTQTVNNMPYRDGQ